MVRAERGGPFGEPDGLVQMRELGGSGRGRCRQSGEVVRDAERRAEGREQPAAGRGSRARGGEAWSWAGTGVRGPGGFFQCLPPPQAAQQLHLSLLVLRS